MRIYCLLELKNLFILLLTKEKWEKLGSNFSVAIHDLVMHPRDGDLIAGTHGKSVGF